MVNNFIVIETLILKLQRSTLRTQTVFKEQLKDTTVHIQSDNAASIAILQTGRGRSHSMLSVARSIWWLAIRYNISFKVSHVLGVNNEIADTLSRAHLNTHYAEKLENLRRIHGATIVDAKEDYFTFQDYVPYSKQLTRGAKKPTDPGP